MTRLPTPGGDDNQWGDILNDYLAVEHNTDGSLKKAADIADAKTKANAAIPSSQKGVASGVASLDSGTKLTASQLPASVITKSTSSSDTGKAIDAYSGNPLAVASAADITTLKAGLELNIRDTSLFPGIDHTGVTDCTAALNAAILYASQQAATLGIRQVRLGGFARGIYLHDGLRVRSNVWLDFDESRHVKRIDGGSMLYPTLVQTAKAQTVTGTLASGSNQVTALTNPTALVVGRGVVGTGVPAGTTITAINWTASSMTLSANATASGTAVSLTINGFTYYGNGQDIRITGGEFDPNGKTCVSGIIGMKYTERMVLEHMTVLHNLPAGNADWAFSVGGRAGAVTDCKVLGGNDLFEDGIHIFHGQGWTIKGCYVESGDDAYPVGQETGSIFMKTDPDPISNITLVGNVAKSEKGYALKVYNSPFSSSTITSVNTGPDPNYAVTNVEVDGLTGTAGRSRNGGISIIDQNTQAPGQHLISRIGARGIDLSLGSASHDGVSAYGVIVESATDVKIDASIDWTNGSVTSFISDRLRKTAGASISVRTPKRGTVPDRLGNLRADVVTSGESADRKRVRLYDDFNGSALSSTWQSRVGSDAACSVAISANQPGGVLVLTPGGGNTNGVETTDGAQIDTYGLNWKAAPSSSFGNLVLEARVKLTVTTGILLAIAFSNQNSAIKVPLNSTGSGPHATVSNAVGIVYDATAVAGAGTGVPNWWAVGAKNSTVIGQDLGYASAGGVNAPWITWRIEIDWAGTLTVEKDGLPIGTPLANAVDTSVALTPVIAVVDRISGITRGVLNVDYVMVEQLRPPT
ncbi:MAG TPA: hypothetical protein VK534_01815 [Methylomirabilota bacterium]|nr:hypothetical protein [Methylomirabilota bacterium]